LSCDDASLPHQDNLVVRAADAFATKVGRRTALEIELRKRIPIGGGLGGGSSDAASTLWACNALIGSPLDDAALMKLGTELGSDVPLFFSLPSAELTGRGEQVRGFAIAWRGWALLVFVPAAVPTAEVYTAWRPFDSGMDKSSAVPAIAGAQTADQIMRHAFNDLEPAVFAVCPRVHEVHNQLNCAGSRPFRVTGAGSTLFRLFDDSQEAHHEARRIERSISGVRATVVAAPAGPGTVVIREDA
jgi:4-diphosphocytidyl-2-C-methyl-D-erythritol kinase